MVKRGTVLPSQKGNCHPVLAEFGNHQFSFLNIDKRENIIFKRPDFFEAAKPFQSQNTKRHEK